MTRQNPPGRPTDLTPELMEHILSFVDVLSNQTQVARLAQIPQPRLSEWLKWGKEDHLNGVDSIYAQLAIKFEQIRGFSIKSMLMKIDAMGTFQALAWILENCHREEFGKDAGIIQKILDQQEKILRLHDKPIKEDKDEA